MATEPNTPETSDDPADEPRREKPSGERPSRDAPPEEKPSRETPSPGDALHVMGERIAEVVDYLLYYISARIDTLKFAIKKRIFTASWIAIAVLAGAGAIITGVVLLCEGICDALSVLLGHRWAGELVTGILLLGFILIGGFGSVWYLIRRSQLKSVAKYEAMRNRERERFGGDGAERKSNSASN